MARILRDLGFPVLEADRMAHQVIEPGQPAYDDVRAIFGDTVLDANKRIDRGRLATIVFDNREKLNELNAIIHPRVEEKTLQRFAELEDSGKHAAAFIEAALIFEAGLHRKLDGVVVAWCLPEQQLARLIERGMNESEARKRIAMQMPVPEKLALGSDKIDCSGSFEETRRQVEAFAAKLHQTSPGR